MKIEAVAPVCALLVLSAAVSASAQSRDGAWLGLADCQFRGLASLGEGAAHWVGECRAGRAQGLGMIRMRIGPQALNAFFGLMENGRPVEGAIETAEGWIVGRAEGGDLVSARDFNERDRAFDMASRAAQAVSDHYRRAGNRASAEFYAKLRERIDLQME